MLWFLCTNSADMIFKGSCSGCLVTSHDESHVFLYHVTIGESLIEKFLQYKFSQLSNFRNIHFLKIYTFLENF